MKLKGRGYLSLVFLLFLCDEISLISHLHIAGIATQTILTIPVNHVTSGQMVNLALSNGQVVTTTLANLQTLAQPHHLLAPASAAAAAAAVAASTGSHLETQLCLTLPLSEVYLRPCKLF
jgi:hypothetical protein